MTQKQGTPPKAESVFNGMAKHLPNLVGAIMESIRNIRTNISVSEMTSGINVTEDFLEGMRQKGWSINIAEIKEVNYSHYPSICGFFPLAAGDSSYVLTIYDAQKTGKEADAIMDKDSGEWHKDACKVLESINCKKGQDTAPQKTPTQKNYL